MSGEKEEKKPKIDPRLVDIFKATVYQLLAYLVGHILKELIEKIQF